ncbi:uncharacterized protein LOC127280644 [Leptopilina boulardi]|uniref:uncharacterized protein LOC127280644 n=1 Tax=Leptopilina boulardi TaxID=63433 RepID=UPI0021F568D1|nr:uncharacterized protein LOC127280644 [Leptopilina boulardi]
MKFEKSHFYLAFVLFAAFASYLQLAESAPSELLTTTSTTETSTTETSTRQLHRFCGLELISVLEFVCLTQLPNRNEVHNNDLDNDKGKKETVLRRFTRNPVHRCCSVGCSYTELIEYCNN